MNNALLNLNMMLQRFCYPRITIAFTRLFSISSFRDLNQKWREERGLPMNPNACGILTDKPDYSYVDGRPTPMGIRQRGRLWKQKEIAAKIIALTGEMDFAIDRYKQIQVEAENTKKAILANKLKPKGEFLYKKQ